MEDKTPSNKIDESKIPKLEFLQNLFSQIEGPMYKYIGNECVVPYQRILTYVERLIAENGSDPWCNPMRELAILFGQHITGKSKDEIVTLYNNWPKELRNKPL